MTCIKMRFDCIPPEFSPFRNLKKNIGKLNSLTVRKKKKKKKIPTDRPNFQILVGWGQHNIFLGGALLFFFECPKSPWCLKSCQFMVLIYHRFIEYAKSNIKDNYTLDIHVYTYIYATFLLNKSNQDFFFEWRIAADHLDMLQFAWWKKGEGNRGGLAIWQAWAFAC